VVSVKGECTDHCIAAGYRLRRKLAGPQRLKVILRKTGTCRQAELVIVILTALPDCLKQP
jgi:hypothetical protein